MSDTPTAPSTNSLTIGVLSDTHGTLPLFVIQTFQKHNVSHIIHGGDVCDMKIISTLQKLAPTTWVRGNMDSARNGNVSEVIEFEQHSFYVLHNIYNLDIDPESAQMSVVIHGHLHVPSIEWKNEILFLNPGSCVAPRGGHPPSCAIIEIQDHAVFPKIVSDI